jgi:hypothetical protein
MTDSVILDFRAAEDDKIEATEELADLLDIGMIWCESDNGAGGDD